MFTARRQAVRSVESLHGTAGRCFRRHASTGHAKAGEGAHHIGHGHHAKAQPESLGVRQHLLFILESELTII